MKNCRKFRKSQMRNNFQNPNSYPKITANILVYFLQASFSFLFSPKYSIYSCVKRGQHICEVLVCILIFFSFSIITKQVPVLLGTLLKA